MNSVADTPFPFSSATVRKALAVNVAQQLDPYIAGHNCVAADTEPTTRQLAPPRFLLPGDCQQATWTFSCFAPAPTPVSHSLVHSADGLAGPVIAAALGLVFAPGLGAAALTLAGLVLLVSLTADVNQSGLGATIASSLPLAPGLFLIWFAYQQWH